MIGRWERGVKRRGGGEKLTGPHGRRKREEEA